jgi:hypothetical protein
LPVRRCGAVEAFLAELDRSYRQRAASRQVEHVMASVMTDEIRLRAHARPFDETS